MDGQLQVLLLLAIVIVAVFVVITTGVHIVRPGEIGFLYRRGKFLKHFGPAFVFGTPVISKMYRLNVKTLHILFEHPVSKVRDVGTTLNLKTEMTLDIADPSRVPIRDENLGAEVRRLASDAFEKTVSRMRSEEDRNDPSTIAKELRTSLNEAIERIGLRVAYLKVGEHEDDPPVGKLAGAKIPSWDDLSRTYET